jgi:phosphoglycerol transferase MdoB-like AlkP superfamily enzyme
MQRNENPYLNSVAYTDSCLGVFIETLKQSPLWKNTLLVFVPDHTMRYPDTIQNTDPNRYKIPIIWAGGAISKPMRVERYGSQIDLAATLLYQLGIDHSDFTFSKNLLNPNNPQFGFFTFVDGFGFASPQREVVYDHAQKKVVYGDPTSEEVANGKAFLQCLYDDLAKR